VHAVGPSKADHQQQGRSSVPSTHRCRGGWRARRMRQRRSARCPRRRRHASRPRCAVQGKLVGTPASSGGLGDGRDGDDLGVRAAALTDRGCGPVRSVRRSGCRTRNRQG
jgi:hypothetical protein